MRVIRICKKRFFRNDLENYYAKHKHSFTIYKKKKGGRYFHDTSYGPFEIINVLVETVYFNGKSKERGMTSFDLTASFHEIY